MVAGAPSLGSGEENYLFLVGMKGLSGAGKGIRTPEGLRAQRALRHRITSPATSALQS